MNEEYLFRGKRIDNGEWVEGNLIQLKDEYGELIKSIIIPAIYLNMFMVDENAVRLDFMNWYEIDPGTICRCSCLRDRNGELIWENDLLDGYEYPFLSDGSHNYFAEVCYLDDDSSAFAICIHKYVSAHVRGISEGVTEIIENWNPNNWKVIGNIFDNKELLQKM